ncbi:MAG TPA: RNA polymerase recycling motor HelD [Candidatus Atribacteria bacterium]|nr:RNA polymerase recycling motor HelD [Candidatus Atribacteria bacterium]
MDDAQYRAESKRLDQVYTKLLDEYERRRGILATYKKSLVTAGRYLWEEGAHVWQRGDLDAAAEVKQSIDALKVETEKYRQAVRLLTKLERLKETPYFGRIDFVERGYEDKEEVYIGTSSFFDENGDILIYDWRAPISSMFYDYGLGKASYMCPEGLIEGDITLKRQYKISGNKLHYMFDTGIKIDDELLQEILSKNADEKMRSIVTTIQREQNRIIRDEGNQLLMLQGVAGSGKTSIALHRIAYLLYRYRDINITSKDILIFSPNTVFNDYISHVLPELGEENMQQTTFDDYIRTMIGPEYRFEEGSAHMEYILTAGEKDGPRLKLIAYKSSMGFYRLLNSYAHYLEHNAFKFHDVVFRGKVLVRKEDIEKLFFEDYAAMPIVKRLKRISLRLHYLIRPAWKQRLSELEQELAGHPEYKDKVRAYSRLFVYREFKAVRQDIESMLAFDTFRAYWHMFVNEEFLDSLDHDTLPADVRAIIGDESSGPAQDLLGYENAAAYVYLKGMLEGVPSMGHIKHVVVDEAQDYTPVQYGILKQVFPTAGMTLLGDINQTINPLKGDFDYGMLLDILKPRTHVLHTLSTGYRSTSEIVDFTRPILGGGQEIRSIRRSGEKPRVIKVEDKFRLIDRLADDIQKLRAEGYGSIGIITKTAVAAQALHHRLSQHMKCILVKRDDKHFTKGIVVIPVYLAKGLEFDAALVVGADAQTYGLDRDRKLLYTACTRAMHRLNVYHTGDISPFVAAIPEDCYIQEQA